MSKPAAQIHIGYYNPATYPVAFTSNMQNRGPANIDGRSPVLNAEGKLVPYDEDLERQVRDGLLKRIMPGTAEYKKWVNLNAQVDKQKVTVSMPASEAPVGPQSISADSGKPIDYDVETVDGVTYYNYQGKRFGSLNALRTYQESQKP